MCVRIRVLGKQNCNVFTFPTRYEAHALSAYCYYEVLVYAQYHEYDYVNKLLLIK